MSVLPRIVSCTLWMLGALLSLSVAQDSDLDALREARCAWRGPVDAGLRRAAAVLRESRTASEPAPALAERLASPGMEACAPLLEILVQGRVPRALETDAAQLLSEPQRELVIAALSRLPAKPLRAVADAKLADVGDPGVNSARLDVLRLVGTGADLSGLFARAPRDVSGGIDTTVAVRMRRTCAAILHRDPAALASLKTVLESRDDVVGAVVLHVLGDVRDPRGLACLYDAARTRPALRQLAVSLVSSIRRSDDAELEQDFALWLAGQVDLDRPEWTRVVVRALGDLDDGSGTSTLIDVLECDHPGLREVALSSLQRISGLRYPAQVDVWRRWRLTEQAWFDRMRTDSEAALRSADPQQVLRALQAYGERSLFRRELSQDVQVVLDRREPALREVACSVLGRLGAHGSIPALVERLVDDHPSVATAAWIALKSLTGEELPRDPVLVRSALRLE